MLQTYLKLEKLHLKSNSKCFIKNNKSIVILNKFCCVNRIQKQEWQHSLSQAQEIRWSGEYLYKYEVDNDILTFLGLNIEVICSLHLKKSSIESSFKNHVNKAIISCTI